MHKPLKGGFNNILAAVAMGKRQCQKSGYKIRSGREGKGIGVEI